MNLILWSMAVVTILAMWRTRKRRGPAAIVLACLLGEWALALCAFRLPSAGLVLLIGAYCVLECGAEWLLSSTRPKAAGPE